MTRHDDDRLPPGTTHVRGREAAVVARLQALSTQLDDEPDPQYRARARARLVAMAAVRTPAPARRSLAARMLHVRAGDGAPSRWRSRVAAGLAGAAVCGTGLAALVAVATGAQPGDPLYGLKRGTEQTQLAVAGESRGRTLLELADTRLDELRTISRDAELVQETLRSMDQQTTEGAALLTSRAVAERDPDALRDLAAWSEQQSTELESLEPELAPAAEPAYVESAGLLAALATRTTGLALALDCPSGPATVGADALGPVPGLCLTEVPPAPPAVPTPDQDAVTADPTTPPEAAVTPSAPATSDTTTTPPPTVPGTAVVPTTPVPPTGEPALPTDEPALPTDEPALPTDGPALPTGPLLPSPEPTGTDPTESTGTDPTGTPSTAPTGTTPPPVAVPDRDQISICLPPLATVGC